MSDIAAGARVFVTKVKYTNERMNVEYTVVGEKVNQMQTLVSNEAPLPELVQCLKDMVRTAAEIWGLGPDYEFGMRVTGASFTENEKQGFGAAITALKEREGVKGVLVMNCPHFVEPLESNDGQASVFTEDQAKLVRTLQALAVDYVRGARAQPVLPFDARAAAAGEGRDQDEDLGPPLPFGGEEGGEGEADEEGGTVKAFGVEYDAKSGKKVRRADTVKPASNPFEDGTIKGHLMGTVGGGEEEKKPRRKVKAEGAPNKEKKASKVRVLKRGADGATAVH